MSWVIGAGQQSSEQGKRSLNLTEMRHFTEQFPSQCSFLLLFSCVAQTLNGKRSFPAGAAVPRETENTGSPPGSTFQNEGNPVNKLS